MGEVNSPPASSGHLFQFLKADFHLMKLKVVLLSEMLQPYRVPVFNALAERDDLEFHVLLLSLIEANREWEVPFTRCRFEYTVLPSRDFYIHSLDWGLHFNKGVTENLDRLNPDVIVGTGYSSPTLWIAQHWAKKHKRGYVLWSGSTEASSRLQNPLIKVMKRLFVRRCDPFLTYGSEATRTIANLGASPDRIVTGCNTVDIDEAYQKSYAKLKGEDTDSMTAMQIRKYNTGTHIELAGSVKPVNAMEDLTITFTM